MSTDTQKMSQDLKALWLQGYSSRELLEHMARTYGGNWTSDSKLYRLLSELGTSEEEKKAAKRAKVERRLAGESRVAIQPDQSSKEIRFTKHAWVLAQDPALHVREIVELARKQGIELTDKHVYAIRTLGKKKTKTKTKIKAHTAKPRLLAARSPLAMAPPQITLLPKPARIEVSDDEYNKRFPGVARITFDMAIQGKVVVEITGQLAKNRPLIAMLSMTVSQVTSTLIS